MATEQAVIFIIFNMIETFSTDYKNFAQYNSKSLVNM